MNRINQIYRTIKIDGMWMKYIRTGRFSPYRNAVLYGLSLLILLGSLSSCSDRFQELNSNPLALNELSDEFLFTNAVRHTFGRYEHINGYQMRFGSQYAHVYVTNSEMRQADLYNSFHIQDLYSNLFDLSYSTALRHITAVLDLTGPEGTNNKVRHAIAGIIAGVNYIQLTDTYGDIPYTEGARGNDGILYASYDSQEFIYQDVMNNLKSSIDILKSADPENAYPGADPVYQNNLEKWIKFANSYRFRLAMRIRFVDPSTSKKVIGEVMAEPMIEDNEDNFMLTHTESDNTDLYNPWYDVRRHANFKMSKKFVDQLKTTDDPRLEVLVLPNEEGEYKGFINGLTDRAFGQYVWGKHSNPASILYAKDQPLYLMTAAEIAFLKAEAALFDLIPGEPEAFYQEGIRLDLSRWSINTDSIQWFLDAPAAHLNGTDEEMFEKISTQSWIAYVPNYLEAWTNIRRTGYPVVPVRNRADLDKGVTDGVLPRRFLYPATEYSGNGANVKEAVARSGPDAIDTPVWWDVRD